MDLVQDHGGDAIKTGIGLQAAQQKALGDDLDTGFGGTGTIQARAVADGLPDVLVQQRRHAGRGGSGGKAAGFQHQDAGIFPPRRPEQRERDQGGLASARWGNEYGVAAGVQRGMEGWQGISHGKFEVRKHGTGFNPSWAGWLRNRFADQVKAALDALDAQVDPISPAVQGSRVFLNIDNPEFGGGKIEIRRIPIFAGMRCPDGAVCQPAAYCGQHGQGCT